MSLSQTEPRNAHRLANLDLSAQSIVSQQQEEIQHRSIQSHPGGRVTGFITAAVFENIIGNTVVGIEAVEKPCALGK